MRRRALVGAALALAMAAGAAYAAIPGPGGTIHGCYKAQDAGKTGGATLAVVEAGVPCKNNETALTFAQQGPQGLPGAPGPQGAPGPAGPAGPAGMAGIAFDSATRTLLSVPQDIVSAPLGVAKRFLVIGTAHLGSGSTACTLVSQDASGATIDELDLDGAAAPPSANVVLMGFATGAASASVKCRSTTPGATPSISAHIAAIEAAS